MILYSNYNPNFKCKIDVNAKGLVNASIGLITYDEAVYAGSYFEEINDTFYLKGIMTDTMSPAGFANYNSTIWYLNGSSKASGVSVSGLATYSPVINLKSDIKASGTGTSSDPFVIE